ncbi:uncharacterized protein LOC5514963 [Nematostella vectensis]|nr:uncharacterized protein LOC5514963 [Nematostella vectensis]XP_032240420.1 uncharacterized protein LOC5514963 [Nematostella vectensis]
MTVVLQSTGFHGFGMDSDPCLELDESYFADNWETTEDELTFLCSNQSDEEVFGCARGTKRARDAEDAPIQKNLLHNTSIATNLLLNTTTNPQEQGKFLLQLSFDKLRLVEDPESCLRRSVLINNTLKLVHSEIYGVKTPFGLSGAMTLDSQRIENGPLPPARKRSRFTTGELCSPPRSKNYENSRFLHRERKCERECCTLVNMLSHDDMDDVFPNNIDKEASILSDLDSVFHSFVCALET